MTGVNPNLPPAIGGDSRVAAKLAALEREIRQLKSYLNGGSLLQVPVVSALPTPGRKGRTVVLITDSKLYVDNGLSWVAQT